MIDSGRLFKKHMILLARSMLSGNDVIHITAKENTDTCVLLSFDHGIISTKFLCVRKPNYKLVTSNVMKGRRWFNIIELVKKAQKGNETAFTEIFEQYEAVLYRTAYVYLKNKDDALDAVQETAYRSFKLISTLKEPKYFKTWLIRIAISCSIDILRKRKNVIMLVDEHEISSFESLGDEDIPLSMTLHDLIDQLDEDEKNVILLRFYHDFTIKEVAETLGIALGSAKTVLYRALKKMRKKLEGDDAYE
ncbi:sigma-70 family RNA polymerase sigma factor [Paenibacillus sp. LHD-38]|uniref:sigma-70 family RNA polymerase sigma factor n=1 Tax=Paenibacillus sp. LHD-38 TaxID=3072143 RepID=UPI00280EDA75|nr:sigma-70 family RNA polymerase sigma factor [Paenibacillus sp. LHD-38]MDQ8738237.1 sigma-70 family RNA polymerase sigma factor [Paenibacillus sp. LHD-38]